MTKFVKRKECWVGLALAAVLGTGSSTALGEMMWGDASGNHLKVGGYVRGWVSFNLADLAETRQDDKWDSSMIRGSVSLTGVARTGPITWGAVVRADQETSTSFTDRLEKLTVTGDRWGGNGGGFGTNAFLRSLLIAAPAQPAAFPTRRGPGADTMEEYNQVELREFYAEGDLIPQRLKLRFGKQQVVWGETDFFRAMDLVHGYDMRWRSFLEPENEELRKPLIMANFMLQVPEADGMLQAIVRPGWDSPRDIGNEYDFYGGRWGFGPLRGTDVLNPATLTAGYDRHHPDGDVDDATYGVRWRQIAGPVTYSVAYLKTYNSDPIVSFKFSAPLTPGATGLLAALGIPGITTIGQLLTATGDCATAKNPAATCFTDYKGDNIKSALGEVIFPKIELFGFTATAYAPALDAVLSTEIVYTRNAPFNTGTNFAKNLDNTVIALRPAINALVPGLVPPEGVNAPGAFAGFRGIKKKEQLSTMLHFDKTLRWLNSLLGTSELPFFTMQIFDKWILGFDKKDDIVEIPGFNSPKREHSTIVTAVLVTQFKNSTINPSFAGGFDPRNGGGFLIPAVEFVFGDHWRLRVEADLFFPVDERKQSGSAATPNGSVTGAYNRKTYLFGALNNQDQLLVRLTRQF